MKNYFLVFIKISSLLKKHLDKIVILGLAFTAPLFFWNLGGPGLADFDEGWYASIVQNIVQSGNLFPLTFNGGPFFDHPPLGFWLMSIPMSIFGSTEFAVRLTSAFLGWLTLFLIYFIGKKIYSRAVGIGASLITVSSVWFTLRARSGNLDAILIFFLMLTIFLGLQIKRYPNVFPILGISLAALLLTKSFVGFIAFIPLLVIFYFEKVSIRQKYFVYAGLIFAALLLTWFTLSWHFFQEKFILKMLHIGLRSDTRIFPNISELFRQQALVYLHYAIEKWYYPCLISIPVSFLILRKHPLILLPLLTILLMMSTFLTNSDVAIWHLLPLVPFIGILIATVTQFVISTMFDRINFLKNKSALVGIFTLIPIFFLTFVQIKNFIPKQNYFDHGLGDRAVLAKIAAKSPKEIYIDGPDLPPTVVFYSNRHVQQLIFRKPPETTLGGFLFSHKEPFQLFTERWRLNLDKINVGDFKIIAEKNGIVLLSSK